MSWVMIILLLIASYLILVPLLTYLSAKRQIGLEVASESGEAESRLIYFYSESCPPCKQMTPIIDDLSRHHGNISKINISDDPEAARQYKIRATPTLILVKDGVIDDILLGAKKTAQIENLLNKIEH
ncbi:MAG: thioredoxin family protein [Candidatus Thiodiazotropha lotti]|uniref:Thiol reductase thioredoxin n=1 Tax=Candidatus Thiodiazotropha endoloripes TaxID=1818881 RepID=A0A1E2UKV6_9GAMM|nr:thioredoxin family protein [Candidatus Thiodiazotropha endoloripes]MCG7898271.1 thioredoxin family protein [Candidatus Thiodiazotropha weberae]MCG7992155.1 thioredoxin family protein [Candidatus Thiodiazotropha lotti]MCG7903368.1 thioredoxin family protein [Candidatus Thiodiazotropha weberae]MCG7915330.1 thioredoxin family protein [Candidatus Thiodiazotropha weberae]MCG7998660.1 thioredoxin family protein [Candidatus Thiodiazotropha lotti]